MPGAWSEQATAAELFARPLHPYTRGLLRALPRADDDGDAGGARPKLAEIPGIVPALTPADRRLRLRPALRLCRSTLPDRQRRRLVEAGASHLVACWEAAPRGGGGGMSAPASLEVEGLVKHFPVTGGLLQRRGASCKAVDGVSFAIRRGETLGLVGESGCGKTTVSRMVLKLIEPTAGRIVLGGVDVTGLSPAQMWEHRRRVQIVFQDPYSSLNPRLSAGTIVGEPMENFRIAAGKDKERRVAELFARVGLRRGEHGQVPARVFRRPAPAARHRQGALRQSRRDRRRRAGLGARCLGARPGAEPDDRACRTS